MDTNETHKPLEMRHEPIGWEMIRQLVIALLAAAGLFMAVGCATTKPQGSSLEEQQQFVLEDTSDLLETLYERKPKAKAEVENAIGYGVFRYRASKLPVILSGIGGGAGYGVATDTSTDENTFMKVSKLQWGVGLGTRELAVVFIFNERDAFERFRTGKWDTGGGAEVTAKTEQVGAALDASAATGKGFKSYTFTETGLSYGATWHARKFSPNKAMNSD